MKHRLLSALLPICLLILAACGTTTPTEGTGESTSSPAAEIITREETTAMQTSPAPEREYGRSGLLKDAVVVFTGDSITDGYRVDRTDPTDLGQNNYVVMFNHYIQKNFPEDNITVYNTGHSGYWIQHLHQHLQDFVYDLDPDYLIVNIGTNNAWFDKGSIESVETAYRALIDELMEKTHAEIILVQPYLFECDFVLDGVALNTYIPRMEQIADIVCRVAGEKGLPVIFYHELFRQAMAENGWAYKPHLSGDGIHPSTDGYRLFFDALAQEMQLPGYRAKYDFDYTAIRAKYGIKPYRDGSAT